MNPQMALTRRRAGYINIYIMMYARVAMRLFTSHASENLSTMV